MHAPYDFGEFIHCYPSVTQYQTQTNYHGCGDVKCITMYDQGAVSIRKTVLPGMAIPMLKIRRPNGRLIFNMEIAIRR